MRICKEILKISTFVGIFCMFCPLWTCILQFYVSLNCYMPKCVSYFPFSCGTLQKSKNWFDVLNFGFSHIHGYSGSTVIRDSRVCSYRSRFEPKNDLKKGFFAYCAFVSFLIMYVISRENEINLKAFVRTLCTTTYTEEEELE